MKAKEAILQVLREAGEPLHFKETTRRITAKGLWKTKGKSPEQTIYNCLSNSIKSEQEESPFRKESPGVFRLRNQSGSVEDIATMTFLDAAEHALEEHGKKEPMHYRDITEEAHSRGWLVTKSKTPESTMAAQISIDTDRSRRRGITPRFIRHGKGFYGLSKWVGRKFQQDIELHNQRVRKDLLKQVRDLPPDKFEVLAGQLLTALGFDKVEVTRLHKDGGIDARGTLAISGSLRIRMAVQAKRWRQNVQAPVVREVRGSLGTHEQGLIITTSGFGAGAKDEASRPDAVPIGLLDGEQLVELLVENNLGIDRTKYDVMELRELGKLLEEGEVVSTEQFKRD